MISGAKNMVPIAIATAIAGIVVGTITLTGFGQVLVEVIETLSGGNIYLILILSSCGFISIRYGFTNNCKLYRNGVINCASYFNTCTR